MKPEIIVQGSNPGIKDSEDVAAVGS